jgi:dehydrogenase/reductase SDR family member 7B
MKQNFFAEKVIWITGASSGIGEQLAYQLANQGAKLILSSRRVEELERVKKQCGSAEVTIIALDLGKEDSVKNAATEVLAKFPRIDYLFNNGGISQRSLTIDTDLSVDRRIFEVNFFGNILLSKMVGKRMVEQKSGHIIVTSSLVGKWGFYLRSAYAASKHALHGFYESMRMEVEKDGVAISLVLPGFTQTSISQNALEKDGKATASQDENQKNGLTAEYVAEKILKGVEKKKFEISIGRTEALGLIVKRYWPSLFERMVRKWSAK